MHESRSRQRSRSPNFQRSLESQIVRDVYDSEPILDTTPNSTIRRSYNYSSTSKKTVPSYNTDVIEVESNSLPLELKDVPLSNDLLPGPGTKVTTTVSSHVIRDWKAILIFIFFSSFSCRLKRLLTKYPTTQMCRPTKISHTKMNSITRWTVPRQPIQCIPNVTSRHRNDCRLAVLRAPIKRTFTKMKRIIRPIELTVDIGHHRLVQRTQSRARIKHTFTSVKSTKRKIMCTDHRRLVQRHDPFHRNCDQFRQSVRPFSMNAPTPIPQIGITIIHRAAFPSIRKMAHCVQYRRERSKRICTKRKHRTQRIQRTVRQSMSIRHAIVSFQWVLRHTLVRHTQVRQPNQLQTFTNIRRKPVREMWTNENHWCHDRRSLNIWNHHKLTEHRQNISDNCWPRSTM